MDVLIIIKWLTNYSGHEYLAPSIISTMINIPLASGYIKGKPFIGSAGLNQAISMLFFIICILCVPWMLFVKPFILKKRLRYENYEKGMAREIELEDLRNNNYEEEDGVGIQEIEL
mmetsp:Transcript_8206/g.6119  ORF Transcript_8206/g.6119 Transcript_8206/m.6119 type:complete len:116 (-) Transcript_8206:454-801(-)